MKETFPRQKSNVSEPPCELKFGQAGIANLRIKSLDLVSIEAEMQMKVASAPQLLQKAPLIIDINFISPAPASHVVRELWASLKRAGVLPVGLAYGTTEVSIIAKELDLPLLAKFHAAYESGPLAKVARTADLAEVGVTQKSSRAPEPQAQIEFDDDYLPTAARNHQAKIESQKRNHNAQLETINNNETLSPTAPNAALDPTPMLSNVHTLPIRSGQQVYARGNDLVVVNTVGAGAEVVADGCVHIYGALRGRALAGARGDVKSQIFCREFYAELVAIAGNYKVMETIPGDLRGQAVRVWLEGDEIKIAKLS